MPSTEGEAWLMLVLNVTGHKRLGKVPLLGFKLSLGGGEGGTEGGGVV